MNFVFLWCSQMPHLRTKNQSYKLICCDGNHISFLSTQPLLLEINLTFPAMKSLSSVYCVLSTTLSLRRTFLEFTLFHKSWRYNHRFSISWSQHILTLSESRVRFLNRYPDKMSACLSPNFENWGKMLWTTFKVLCKKNYCPLRKYMFQNQVVIGFQVQ